MEKFPSLLVDFNCTKGDGTLRALLGADDNLEAAQIVQIRDGEGTFALARVIQPRIDAPSGRSWAVVHPLATGVAV